MDVQEVENLTQKVKDGTATPEEQLALLNHMNKGVEELKDFIKELKAEEAK